MSTLRKKINEQLIASFRNGEVIDERKLNQIFTLIGEAINSTYTDYLTLVDKLNELHLASR